MIDIRWEILRTLLGRKRQAKGIAAALSEPTPIQAVLVPLADLLAEGLVKAIPDRGHTTYSLTGLGRAEYIRLLRRDRQIFRSEARMEASAFVRL
jgi:DNA-binding transcriptional ArsR family regulator